MEYKRILITAAAGFLGSHLCEKLLNEKNNMIHKSFEYCILDAGPAGLGAAQ